MAEMNGQENIPSEVDGGIDPQTHASAQVLLDVVNESTEEQSKLLKEIVTRISNETVNERNYMILTEYTRRFVNNLGFSGPFSVSRTKEIINILLVMWNQPNVARYVMKEVYKEDIKAAGTVDEEMLKQFPSDLKQLDDKAAEIYAKALKYGSEKVKNIRLMVVGMFGVGKTSLVNNLIKDLRDENIIPTSTEGIDLRRCQLMENGDWCLDKEQKQARILDRLKNAFRKVIQNPTDRIPTFEAPVEQAITNSVPVEDDNDADDSDTEEPPDPLEAIRQNVEEHKEDEGVRDILPMARELDQINKDSSNNTDVSAETKTDTTVSVWDFAGQTLYYSTHQFFLNKRSIYLVLMDMTKSLDEYVKEDERSGTWCGLVQDCTYLDVFKFWLNAIHMYSSYKSVAGETNPTVILVGTRKDEMKGSDKDKETENDNYFDRALRSFEGSPVLKHIHKRKFLVNNLSPEDSVFGEIREEIRLLAAKQDYWGDNYPIRWIQMERLLDTLRDKGVQLLKMEEIQDQNRYNVHPLIEEELALFLDIQHRHGNILYFNTDELKELIVLAPQWIIEVFKCFITHVRNKDPKLLEHWRIYEELAILKPEVFDEIMDNSPEAINKNKKDVIKYMEYLDVIAKPLKLEEAEEVEEATDLEAEEATDLQEQEDTCTAEPLNAKFLDFHIVPCRLKNPPPPIAQFTSPENRKKSPVLCFVFVENFMPPSFFHRLVAVCIRTWPISKEGKQNLLYNGLAVFDLRATYFLTVWYKDHIIYARISSCSKDHIADLDFNLCQEVRLTLRRSLLNFVGQSLENPRTPTAFDEYIQCPEMTESLYNDGMFRVTQFIYHRELHCRACVTCHSVERAEAMKYWFKDKLDGVDADDDDSSTPAEESHLLKAAKTIGKEYWVLGIQLELSNAQLNQLYAETDCKINTHEFVFKYMVKWRNRNGDKATVQQLNRAINAARLNF